MWWVSVFCQVLGIRIIWTWNVLLLCGYFFFKVILEFDSIGLFAYLCVIRWIMYLKFALCWNWNWVLDICGGIKTWIRNETWIALSTCLVWKGYTKYKNCNWIGENYCWYSFPHIGTWKIESLEIRSHVICQIHLNLFWYTFILDFDVILTVFNLGSIKQWKLGGPLVQRTKTQTTDL